MQPPSFHVETFGCQMNEQDSLRISQQLLAGGYVCAEVPALADIVVINTCSIRRKAEDKVYSMLGRYRPWKEADPTRTLAVGGCVAQQEGKRLLRRVPYVDIVFGPHHVSLVEAYVTHHRQSGGRRVEVGFSEGTTADLECPGIPGPNGVRAFVTIMEGCDNFCTYCIVPYVRGRERSRPFASLRTEVCNLVERGVLDVTLLGQNVNAYCAPDRSHMRFPELLRELAAVDGLKRLRFTTSHPKDLSPGLVQCFGDLEPLCEHIHLPLQSGSDRILRKMNRRYSFEQYRSRVEALRDRCPEIAVTSDLIVGFPGEEKSDFEATLEAVRKLSFDNVFSFHFSPREGTRAADLTDTVPEQVKKERLGLLQEIQKDITVRKNRAFEGRIVEILVEGSSRDGLQRMGRTRTNRIVNFVDDPPSASPLVLVMIERGHPNSLLGSLAACPLNLNLNPNLTLNLNLTLSPDAEREITIKMERSRLARSREGF